MDAVNFLNLQYIFLRIYDFFRNADWIAAINFVIHILKVIAPYSLTISAVIIYIMVYSYVRMKQVEKLEYEKFHSVPKEPEAAPAPVQDDGLAKKWHQIQAHINSTNQSDWRLAILEADIMLNDILEKQGYQGDSIGDKLKTANRNEFITLDAAWEAHKTRNQIAHEGTDFQLSDREAKRVIELYRKVFEEFYHI